MIDHSTLEVTVMTLMRIFVTTCLLMSVSKGQEDPSYVLHGLFSDDNDNRTVVYYGSLNVNNSQFTLISSLNVDDVGNPRHRLYSLTPLTYDPNTDVIYMSALNKENRTILSMINATTGALLRKYNPIENSIISLQYDIFQKQLFAHVTTDREEVTQIVEIDTNSGQFKQVLGRITQARATHISSYCPICRKYFLMGYQDNHFTYIAVNSTDGGGISWQTPVDFNPIGIHFDYKTFNMYTVYRKENEFDVFRLGIVNRTIGGIGKEIKILAQGGDIAVDPISAYDIRQNIYYSLLISVRPLALGISYVNVNTSDGNATTLPRNTYIPYAWFVKQFVH